MQNPHDWVRDETFELWNKYHPECKPKKEYRIKTGFGTRADLAVFVGPDSYPIGIEIVDSHAYEPLAGAMKQLQKQVSRIKETNETAPLFLMEKFSESSDKLSKDISDKILACFKEILACFKDGDKTPDWNAFHAGSAFILTLFAMTDAVLLNAFTDKLVENAPRWRNILESEQHDRFIELFNKGFEFNLKLLGVNFYALFKALSTRNDSLPSSRRRWVVKSSIICPKCKTKGTIEWNRIELIEESEKVRKEKGFDYCKSCDYKSNVRIQTSSLVPIIAEEVRK